MNSDLAMFASSWAVRSTALLVISLLLLVILRKASAAQRHFVLALTFVALLFLPLFSLVLPVWRLAILPPVPAREYMPPTMPSQEVVKAVATVEALPPLPTMSAPPC